jgi:hypothetical protein
VSSLSQFANDLRRLPRVVAIKVAVEAAPILTELAKQTFNAGETPYGVNWREGVQGQRVTLDKTGALKRYIHYVAIGTRLRVALGVPYAKYQIGKRPVFPKQAGALPPLYVAALKRSVARIAKEELG